MSGPFFPPSYKEFPFQEGDLLVSQDETGKFSVSKVLKVDRFNFKASQVIRVQSHEFEVAQDDYLLVVSSAYGAFEFDSFEAAKAAAQAGTWTIWAGHIPNRATGAAEGQTRVGNEPVDDAELEGYRIWREAFEKGEAGIF